MINKKFNWRMHTHKKISSELIDYLFQEKAHTYAIVEDNRYIGCQVSDNRKVYFGYAILNESDANHYGIKITNDLKNDEDLYVVRGLRKFEGYMVKEQHRTIYPIDIFIDTQRRRPNRFELLETRENLNNFVNQCENKWFEKSSIKSKVNTRSKNRL